MTDPICYKAFGLVLESEFPIVQLPVVEGRERDVRIVRADLSGLPLQRGIYSGPDGSRHPDRRGGLRRKDVRADHRPHGRSLPKRCQRIASKGLLSC